MTKQEHITAVKAEGNWDRFTRSPAWTKAFESYNAEQKMRLCQTCHSSYNKVKKWLQA